MAAVSRRSMLVVGDAFADVIAGPLSNLPMWGRNTVSPGAIEAQPGGAAVNVASGLHCLRGDTYLFTGIGHDAFGDMLRRHCSRIGLQLLEAACSDTAQPTGVCLVLSSPEDRAFCSHFGISDQFDAAELIAHQGAALRAIQPPLGHIHCSGYFSCAALRKTLPALLTLARGLGATVSLDTNNDASGAWGSVDGLWSTMLPLCDLFMPNELEACAIAGTEASDLEGAIATLTQQVGGSVIVTLGAKGAVVASRGREPVRVGAPCVDAVDTVGAGDAFKAGFLAAYLAGCSLHEAASTGCLSGALCVTKRGACSSPPSRTQLAAFAAAHGADAGGFLSSADPLPGERNASHDANADADEGIDPLLHVHGGRSTERQRQWWSFCLLWLGGTWPYQAVLQAQVYYSAELPDLASAVLLLFTWPLLLCHTLQVICSSYA